MRTYGNLYPQITSFANLYGAFRRARRGKRGRPEVAAFELDLEHNLFELQAELRDHRYRPGTYRNFYIYERKRRLISAAPFRDRVVHHALCGVLEPIWEARFIHDTYACRPDKGTHAAVDRAQHFARGHAYVLQCDVHQFFPAIDHAILRDRLARHIRCPETLWLVDQILDSGAGVLAPVYAMEWFPGDDLLTPLRRVQSAPTSPPCGCPSTPWSSCIPGMGRAMVQYRTWSWPIPGMHGHQVAWYTRCAAKCRHIDAARPQLELHPHPGAPG